MALSPSSVPVCLFLSAAFCLLKPSSVCVFLRLWLSVSLFSRCDCSHALAEGTGCGSATVWHLLVGGGWPRKVYQTSGTLHFKKADIRHRDKLRAGSSPRPHFIVNLIRKLRLHDTLVHFLSARSLQTSESRSSYPIVKKNTQPPPLVCLKALNIAQGPRGEKKSRRRKPGDVVWPHTNKCHSDPGPSSPCVNAM